MDEQEKQNTPVRFLFRGWQEELSLAAADAIECCITSAYLNIAGVNLLQRVALRLANLVSDSNKKPIKVLISENFAPTEKERKKILRSLLELPGVEVRVHREKRFLHWKNYIFKTDKDIRVIVGSVNSTSGGFFRNLECATLTSHKFDDPEALSIQKEFMQIWDGGIPATSIDLKGETMDIEPKYQVGDNVRIISSKKIGTVNKILESKDSIAYRVTVDGRPTVYQQKYLEPYIDEEQEIFEDLAMQKFEDAKAFHLFQTWFRLKKPIEGNIYSYLASRTIFNPYQFKPLSKFISPGSEERLFIADEVGVGKTIETGIILTELLSRGLLDRRSNILIVCPNSLGPKWVKEMKKRFNLEFQFQKDLSFDEALRSALDTGDLPIGAKWSVASLQMLRHSKYLGIIENINGARDSILWDLIVVDEAHHMRNVNTESNKLGNILSSLTNMMLMLSATPLNLRDEDLFQQMHILNPAMYPDQQTFNAMLSPVKLINQSRRLLAQRTEESRKKILHRIEELTSGPLGIAISSHPDVIALYGKLLSGKSLNNSEITKYDRTLISLSPLDSSFTRTLKRDVIGKIITRRPERVPIDLSEAETDFYNAVINLVRRAYLARGGDARALGFISNMPQRMVSSCIPAMKEYLNWSLENDQMIIERMPGQEEAEDDTDLEQIPLPPELRSEFEILRDQAEEIAYNDSKYAQFIILIEKLLRELENPQIIIFSFFVRTLKYLKKRLSQDGYRVGLICGEIPLETTGEIQGRYEIMEDFERKKLDIFLSSEVGGEGLDFQFCQAIINYDLPYNPMRVEQRIGRIDRFGQQADEIIVANMC